MRFAESARSSLGVEWELVLVDPDTGLPVNRATEVFAAMSGADGAEHPNLRHEFLKNTVEVVTGVCDSVTDAHADLSRTLGIVHDLVARDDVAITSTGLHPFATWRDVALNETERYERVAQHVGWWARQLLIYGVHTHVGVEDERKVPALIKAILAHYGHLQALSAASPFWNGENTGYASNRAMLFRQLPSSGLPPEVDTWGEIAAVMEQMVTAGLVRHTNELRWDVRPSPSLGTIEMRICDGVPTLAEVLALTALSQCIVEHASAQIDAGEQPAALPNWLVAENKWRAARYGMNALLISDVDGTCARADEAIAELIETLKPTAERLGCEAFLGDAQRMLEVGPSYLRQIAVAEEAHQADDEMSDNLSEVMKALVAEHAAGSPW